MSARTQRLELVTPDNNDVPVEAKQQLILQDMQMWRNTRWQAEMRARGAKRVGNADREAVQYKLIDECEGELMHLEEELNALLKD
jgi:hypothetical protein